MPRDTLQSRNLYERCITGDQGPPRVPAAQAVGESQLIQTPDYVVLITQTNSDARIIPLDGRPAPPADIGTYLGISRGRWDGDTLVVETTNFREKARIRRIQEAGPNLHLVERFTRIQEDLLLYEATLTDPTTWEAPWTFEVPWPKLDPPGLPLHERHRGVSYRRCEDIDRRCGDVDIVGQVDTVGGYRQCNEAGPNGAKRGRRTGE